VRSAQTNIVFLDVEAGRCPALVQFLKQHGVLVTGQAAVRWVTHLDVDEAGIDHAIATVRRFFETAPEPAAR
jgi:threonine aldolase